MLSMIRAMLNAQEMLFAIQQREIKAEKIGMSERRSDGYLTYDIAIV